MIDLSCYMRSQAVHERIREYIGSDRDDGRGAVYINRNEIGLGRTTYRPEEAQNFIHRGWDLARSLWDKGGLIAQIDIEYMNADFPAEPYFHPLRSFRLQQAVVEATQQRLADAGVPALHILSGRGHHLVWRIDRGSASFNRLRELGWAPQHLRRYYQTHPVLGETVDDDLAHAFGGLGKLIEFIGWEVKRQCDHELLPVDLCDSVDRRGERGREMVVFDVTAYADPLTTRCLRTPFSLYLKPWLKGGILTEDLRSSVPLMVPVPMTDLDLSTAIMIMRDHREATDYAPACDTRIPVDDAGTSELLDRYQRSALADFHRYFYSERHDEPTHWAESYDRLEIARLSPACQTVLQRPNDLLLKPAGIRTLVHELVALGWHPRHVAGLIRSRYERDYGWGWRWYTYDAACRADYYTRLFAAPDSDVALAERRAA
jgi:hypothetical protein